MAVTVGMAAGLWLLPGVPRELAVGIGSFAGTAGGAFLAFVDLHRRAARIRQELERRGFRVADWLRDLDEEGWRPGAILRWTKETLCAVIGPSERPDVVIRLQSMSQALFGLEMVIMTESPPDWRPFVLDPQPRVIERPMLGLAAPRSGFADPGFDARWVIKSGSQHDIERSLAPALQRELAAWPRRCRIAVSDGVIAIETKGVAVKDVPRMLDAFEAFRRTLAA